MNILFAIFIIIHSALFIIASGFVYLIIKNKEHEKKDWVLMSFSVILISVLNLSVGAFLGAATDKGPILFLFVQAIPIIPFVVLLLGYSLVHYVNYFKEMNFKYPFFLIGSVYGTNLSFLGAAILLMQGVIR